MMKELFMQRCFDLALQGLPYAAPNPIVGALIVYKDKIIGEGFHQKYGESHAEVNAVNSVAPENRHLLPYSTLYVSLEPCNIFGNTPPCTHLVIREKIPEVVISYIDHTPGVDGTGIDYLRSNGVKVTTGILEDKGRKISAIRNTYVTKKRPYIILKYAQSLNNIFAPDDDQQLWLSNSFSKRLVHRWRSEIGAILVGTKTASIDNPQLTNRLYYGPSPLRLTIDRHGQLDDSLFLKDKTQHSLIFTNQHHYEDIPEKLEYIYCPPEASIINIMLNELTERKISSLMVEGGIQLLSTFIETNLWDEARVFVSNTYIKEGRPAPMLNAHLVSEHNLLNDRLLVFNNEFSKSLNFL